MTHVAFAFSDILFVYPVVPSRYFGQASLHWKSSGKVRTVKVLENRLGAAGVVQGAASSGMAAEISFNVN